MMEMMIAPFVGCRTVLPYLQQSWLLYELNIHALNNTWLSENVELQESFGMCMTLFMIVKLFFGILPVEQILWCSLSEISGKADHQTARLYGYRF